MDRHFLVVENDQQLMIDNLSLLTGIYKKPHETDNKNYNDRNIIPSNNSNVVLTTSPQGKILPTYSFKENYMVLNEVSGQQPIELNKFQNSVILIKRAHNESVEDPAPRTNEEVLDKWNKFIELIGELQTNSNQNVIVIEKDKCQICCIDPVYNQKTIYSFLSDVELGLAAPTTPLLKNRKNQSQSNSKTTKRQCEPKTNQNENLNKQHNSVDNIIDKTCAYQRTRSGRSVRRHASQNNGTITEFKNDNDTVRTLINEIKDSDYRCNLKNKVSEALIENDEEEKSLIPKKERHVPPEAICPKCKKIFLGRRLKRHFAQHPDHIIIPSKEMERSENMTLFNYLVLKLYKTELNEDQRAEMFLNEINDLVEQLRCRSSRLIRNTTGLHLVTALTACVIGIPEGQYTLDMSAVLAAPELQSDIEDNGSKTVDAYATNLLNEHNCLDYTALSMSLDVNISDEVAQKLNLSAGGKLLPPSEESLLRNVEDLVPKRINKTEEPIKLSSSCNVQHYEQANDNAVEAVTMKVSNNRDNSAPILELPVDFFSI